jgi:DNA-binding MarR family transcriptional regulator
VTTPHTAASFGAALRRLIDHLDSALEQAYRDDGLDFRPRYTPVIRALMDDGPHTLTMLAERIGVSHSATSQTVSQMRLAGLVVVTRGEDDARQRIVALSRLAKAMQPRLEEHWHAARVATAVLDTETGGVLVEVINRANAALARRPLGERLADARHPTASRTGNRIPAA